MLKQILQGINEMKADISTLKSDVSTLKSDVDSLKLQFKQYKAEYRRDMKKIDLRLNATNETLDSFKFDTDLIIEKNPKLEFSVNRKEKNTESFLEKSL
jgi:outer membrane murein-binding lipoprotein Lpp